MQIAILLSDVTPEQIAELQAMVVRENKIIPVPDGKTHEQPARKGRVSKAVLAIPQPASDQRGATPPPVPDPAQLTLLPDHTPPAPNAGFAPEPLLTLDDVRRAAQQLIQVPMESGGGAAVFASRLSDFSAAKLSDLPPEKYAAFVATLVPDAPAATAAPAPSLLD